MFNPTLPASNYTDPAVFAHEWHALFPNTWQFVARRDELPQTPGSYLATTVLDEPVLLVRDAGGALLAMSNVCRHRAGPVAIGSGVRHSFSCAYHGWTYSLEGGLRACPEFEVAEIPAAQRQLPRYEAVEWGPWVFVRLGGGIAFDEWLGEMIEETEAYRLAELRFERRMSYALHCNWKVYIENYLEPYHLPVVHPALHRMTDYQRYQVECRQWHVRQIGPPRPSSESSEIPLGGSGSESAAWYWAFPNFILNCSFGLVSTNLVIPTGPSSCDLVCDFFVPPDADPAAIEEAIALSHAIQLEDVTICEAVQRGLESASYRGGILHPTREVGVAHFGKLWADGMEVGGTGPL